MEGSALFIATLDEIEALGKIFDQFPVDVFDECWAPDGARSPADGAS